MRQQLGIKKVNKLRRETGLDIIKVFVRGGTDHRQDLILKDKTILHRYPNGEIEESEFKNA